MNQADYNLWRAHFGQSTVNPGVRTDAAVSYAEVPGLELLDFVTYMPQTMNYSQGRLPNGGTAYQFFAAPTPGGANAATASAAAIDQIFTAIGINSPKRSRPTARTIAFTDWATDILRRTHEAARRFNPEATVRLHRAGSGVSFDLTDERPDGDELVRGDGFELLVEDGLDGTVDVVEPHDQLILRPPGDRERSVRAPH